MLPKVWGATKRRKWSRPEREAAAQSVRDFRSEGVEVGSRSGTVHLYGEHRRPEIGSRSRKALMLMRNKTV